MSDAKQLAMKMAKPSDKDYEAFDRLHDIIMSLVVYRIRPEELESELPTEIFDDQEVHAELGQRIEEWWDKHGGSWDRVVFGGQTAIQNACEPNASTLEWKPEIASLLAKAEAS